MKVGNIKFLVLLLVAFFLSCNSSSDNNSLETSASSGSPIAVSLTLNFPDGSTATTAKANAG